MAKSVRSSKVEYPNHKETLRPKKRWVARHPLVGGLIVAAGIGGAAFFISEDENAGKEDVPCKKQSVEKYSKNKRDKRIREQVSKIRRIVEFQKRLIESGWYAERELKEQIAREEMQELEAEFALELEEKSKDELVELLIAQNRIIEQLREGSDEKPVPELVHEENKRRIMQRRLDEIEIIERGLLEQTVEELEALLLELDGIITQENYYPVERYIEAMEDRALIARAIEEKRFWNGVFPKV